MQPLRNCSSALKVYIKSTPKQLVQPSGLQAKNVVIGTKNDGAPCLFYAIRDFDGKLERYRVKKA